MKRWQIIGPTLKICDPEEIFKTLLLARNLKTKKEIKEFLDPLNPLDLTASMVGINQKQLAMAFERINRAVKNRELIVVYGDYDCDGICATAILWKTLKQIGAETMPYIPDRMEDGYGLSKSGLDKLMEKYPLTKLIITVDHGIVAVAQTEYAQKKLGVEVIITDHHTLAKEKPKAFAVVHTTRLSGSGISWFLARELMENKRDKDDFLDLAALGTIADMVGLIGPNRSIAKFGLEKIQQTKNIGLLALFDVSGLDKFSIGVYEIGFILAPRLNALGRIDNALDGLRLLCTLSPQNARIWANKLNEVNLQRQKLTENTLLSVFERVSVTSEQKIIVVADEKYNQGVIGLVAGKLVEKFYLPAIVISKGEKFSKASARSIAGFNIVEAIRSVSEILVNIGGHPMAAGFTIETEKIDLFIQKLSQKAKKEISPEILDRVLKIDCEIPLESANWELFTLLERLRPFGMENPEPVFCSEVEVSEVMLLGKTAKHLKLFVQRNDSPKIECVAFNFAQMYSKIKKGDRIKIAYTLDKNEWNGNRKLQLRIKDIIISNNTS